MGPSDEQIRLAIAEQAADWFVANRTETLGDGGPFTEWLKTSPLHVEEYLRMAAISGELRQALQESGLPISAWMAEATSQSVSVEALRTNPTSPDDAALNVVRLRQAPIPPPERRPRRWISGWRLPGALTIAVLALAAILATLCRVALSVIKRF